ncbi:excalibur calcium-binding domain-containing protein [Acinetobacter sp. YH12073]|uniref:excalibur calcium-binding domain-containing protein n=1 Tax=Acinetobacter sp. YH12073 TaxID=2601069 RepID=UPI0035A0C7D4
MIYEIFTHFRFRVHFRSSLCKKCADFSTQQQAQKWYEQRKKSGQTGWKSLDRDGDGQACDCLPGGHGKKCPKKKK